MRLQESGVGSAVGTGVARRIFAGIAALGLLLFSAAAMASLVAAGSSVLLSGTTATADPALDGTVLQNVISPFSVSLGTGSVVQGYVEDSVVRETATGTLDFYYSVVNGTDSDGCSENSSGSIGVVQRSGFSGFTTDANYRLDSSGTIAPSAASRSADGNMLLFGFLAGSVGPDEASRSFFVRTNAISYNDFGTATLIGFNAQGGFGETQLTAFQPVPLPPAQGLFAAGALILLALSRRRGVRC